MSPEEGRRVIWDRHRDWYMTPVLGDSIPSVSGEDHNKLLLAFERLSAFHKECVPPHELEARDGDRGVEAQGTPYSIPAMGLKAVKSKTEELIQCSSTVLALNEDGRKYSCVDLADAKAWEGRWSRTSRSFAYRTNLLLTKCGRWIRGHESAGEGYKVPPHLGDRGVAFEVVSLEEAVVWFTTNSHPHPLELINALKRPAQTEGLEASKPDCSASAPQHSTELSHALGTGAFHPGSDHRPDHRQGAILRFKDFDGRLKPFSLDTKEAWELPPEYRSPDFHFRDIVAPSRVCWTSEELWIVEGRSRRDGATLFIRLRESEAADWLIEAGIELPVTLEQYATPLPEKASEIIGAPGGLHFP